MKPFISILLFGAASASIEYPQQVLKESLGIAEDLKQNNDQFINELKLQTESIWDIIPDFVKNMTQLTSPKPFSRKPDSTWDYIIKGTDIHELWIENSNGEKEREIEGNFESYNLRSRNVSPKLGIDTVKQYSGYLDDEENDKHLFYCMLNT